MVVSPTTSGNNTMHAEMTTHVDGKKTTGVDEEEHFLAAEALAAEALRLAEEAKRAAERLAEVRATIQFLEQQSKPKPKPKPKPDPIVVETIVEEESNTTITPVAPVPAPAPAALVVDTVDASSDKREDVPQETPITPRPVCTPTCITPTVSPVSILKTASSKSEPKEVRYAPDTFEPGMTQAKKMPGVTKAPSVEETNLIVKFYDAVGIDKICGLELDEAVQQSPVPMTTKRVGLVKKLAMQVDPFEGGGLRVLETTEKSEDKIQQKKVEVKAASCQAEVERDFIDISRMEEVKTEKVSTEANATPKAKVEPPVNLENSTEVPEGQSSFKVVKSDNKVMHVEKSESKVVPQVQLFTKMVVEESTTSRAKVDPPPSDEKVKVVSPAKIEVKKIVSREMPESELPKVTKVASPKTTKASTTKRDISTEVAKDTTSQETRVTATEASEEREGVPAKLETDVSPVDTSAVVTNEPICLSPVKRHLLARKHAPLISKPDPFGGEFDDMDFIPCGSKDAQYPDDDQDHDDRITSPRMLCGWGI